MSKITFTELPETAELNRMEEKQIPVHEEMTEELPTEELLQEVDLERETLTGKDDSEWTFKDLLKEGASYLLIIILSVSISYLLVTYVVQRTVVDGTSMSSTLSNGDNVLIDKISYRFTKPKRFDVVTFDYLYEEDESYIKRIIGLPGESVRIIGGYVYIDRHDGKGYEILSEDIYGNAVIEPSRYGLAASGVTLGEDEYFVMGDNRNNSHDSRKADVGPVKKELIEGRAFFRIWPLSEFGTLKPQGKDQ